MKRAILRVPVTALLLLAGSRTAVRAADLEVGAAGVVEGAAAQGNGDLVRQLADIFLHGANSSDETTRRSSRKLLFEKDLDDTGFPVCTFIVRARVPGAKHPVLGLGVETGLRLCGRNDPIKLDATTELFIPEDDLRIGGLRIMPDPDAVEQHGLVVIDMRGLPPNFSSLSDEQLVEAMKRVTTPLGDGKEINLVRQAARTVRKELQAEALRKQLEESLEKTQRRAEELRKSLGSLLRESALPGR